MGEREEILGLSPTEFAPHLLGAHVSSYVDSQLVVVRITECEAYVGAQDPGSHAYRGKTKRNAALFGPPGTAYIYFTYGMYYCANVVCGQDQIAAGALMRAGEVIIGEDIVRARRSQPTAPKHLLLSGPARLAQGLGLTLELNGSSYRKGIAQGPGDGLGLENLAIDPLPHSTGPRTGVAGIGGSEAYPYRFWLPGERSVSKYRRAAPRKPRGERD